MPLRHFQTILAACGITVSYESTVSSWLKSPATDCAALLRWQYAGHDASLGRRLTLSVAVIVLVAAQNPGRRQFIEKRASAFVIVCPPVGEKHDSRLALAIAISLEFGFQAAFGSPDAAPHFCADWRPCGVV